MSEAVTALGGVCATDRIAEITEAPLQGMITLRADLSDTAVAKIISKTTGLDLPMARESVVNAHKRLCWMSPDELLLLCPYSDVFDTIGALTFALAKHHALVVNVSDARASFYLSGPHARDVLAKLCPVDLSPQVFGKSSFRRTRMAQTPAAFWLTDRDRFQIVCFRSQAQYIFDLLKIAAQPGSEVNNLNASA